MGGSIVSEVEACYRHPHSETAVSCSSCGRAICPDCMTTTPVGMRCPECSKQTTKVRTAATLSPEPTLTYLLIGTNVLLALGLTLGGESLLGGQGGNSPLATLALTRAGVADGEWWRLLTGGFLHFGLLHLVFNMYALYILGGLLEPALGRLRFGLVYFVSLLSGSLGALMWSGFATRGASGAVFGLMGAAFVIMRSRGINPMDTGLGATLLLNLGITFAFAGFISVGGHLGGLAGGAVAALMLVELRERLRVPTAVSTLLVVGLGLLVVAGSIAVSSVS